MPLALVGNLVGMLVIFGKAWFLICVQMWLRWTLPRIRLDQVMDLCLKVLLPASVLFFMVTIAWEVVPWETICRDVPVLHDRLPRFAVFAFYAALVAWWAKWFWFEFQVPMKKSMQEKPWVTSATYTT
jgi:hypothetical protein